MDRLDEVKDATEDGANDDAVLRVRAMTKVATLQMEMRRIVL